MFLSHCTQHLSHYTTLGSVALQRRVVTFELSQHSILVITGPLHPAFQSLQGHCTFQSLQGDWALFSKTPRRNLLIFSRCSGVFAVACIGMAFVVMAYIVLASTVMACIVMAYVVMA